MKKILAIVIGIFLSFIVLEIFLQLAGFVLITANNYKNRILHKQECITILCIGESTTSGEWPPILQKILNKKAKYKKFKVIDEGHAGRNSEYITSKIRQYLMKYNPNIVISMIGINDFGLLYKKSKFKTLNLVCLLETHIRAKFFFDYSDVMVDFIDSQSMDDIDNGNFISAEKKYLRLWKLSNKTSKLMFWRLLALYSQTKQSDKFEIILKESKAKITSPALSEIFKYFINSKKYFKVQLYEYVKSNQRKIDYDDNISLLLQEYGLYSLINNIKQNKVEDNDTLVIKQLFDDKKNALIFNYNYIINAVYKHNNKATMMVMQYPMLSLENLKEQLNNSYYYDRLIFVDNEENFKKALKTYKTENLFKDLFAVQFGHCTYKGNRLIAKNVASKILSLYDKETV